MKDSLSRSRQRAGFSLVELSVVLLIIALITGMAVSSGISVIASARLTATYKKMDAIEQALLAFRKANDRLPCPASLTLLPSDLKYGYEAGSTSGTVGNGACTGGTPAANAVGYGTVNTGVQGAEGAVPTATLGIPSDFMYDGWGRRFRYAVDVNMTMTHAFSGTQTGAVCGAIKILTGPPAAAGASTVKSSGAIYALISQGANGHGGFTQNGTVYNAGALNLDELTNCHCSSTGTYNSGSYTPVYVQQTPFTYNAISKTSSLWDFNDIVEYRERWQMQADWDPAGQTCPGIYGFQANPGIQNVKKFDFQPYSQGTLGTANAGTTNGYLNGVTSVAFDSRGNVYVVDINHNRVQVFDKTGAYVSGIGASYNGVSGAVGSSGSGNGQFNSPVGITIDPSGNIWVVDTGNHRVQKFDSNGNYLLSLGCGYTASSCSIGASSYANGAFKYPQGIAADASGNVWVVDRNNNRLEKFSSSGTFLMGIGCGYNGVTGCSTGDGGGSTIGGYGSGNGMLNWPQFIAIDKGGNIWVTESNWSIRYGSGFSIQSPDNARVQEFSAAGAYLAKFSVAAGPEGIGFDPRGNIWLGTDAVQLQQCTTSGSCTTYSSLAADGLAITFR
ncbi:MAG TPA: 6-bladed beta-propeller [Rickettsiales bacterium]|nr:6-bladed beta-propeller [Rickettsiales bacterium]